MEDFAKKFLEEATDLINDLERAVLALESEPDDEEITNEVFRIMHSLKGGGAMFGFDLVSDFTHNMENIYDDVRSGKRQVSQKLFDITLESVDHLRSLLSKPDDAQTKQKHQNLLERINEILNDQTGEPTANTKDAQSSISDKQSVSALRALYYIYFKPDSTFFDFGNNPLFLLDDLGELGEIFPLIRTDKVPNLDDYDHTVSYCSWEVLLHTNASEEDIKEVFIFAEDECELSVKQLSDNFNVSDANMPAIMKGSDMGNKLDFVVLKEQIEELSEKPQDQEQDKSKTLNEQINKFSKESEISSIRIATEKIDDYMNLVSELVTAQASMKLLIDETATTELQELSDNIENITYRIRDNALSISLIPIENTVIRFRRLVRDLSHTSGKDISFITEGTETRIDKTLLQIITDPLMHIIRNAIDHGIESPEERVAKGKPRSGKISLKAFHSGSSVHVVVEDDGKGIDPEFIRRKAVERGLISPDALISKKEAYELVFKPGFSTTDKVTDVSGRGVGMDVLNRKIADVRGDIQLDSEVNKGTKITLKLPMNLSIIGGLLVKVQGSLFILPLSEISRIHELERTVLDDSFNQVAVIGNRQVPFFFIRQGLELEGEEPDTLQVVEVKYQKSTVGLVFDEIIGEYQAVLKPLSKLYRKLDIMSAASILGDGSVALVLDPNRLVRKLSAERAAKYSEKQ
jgi:two-component system chemotaxis sensor kinase CheA